MKKMPKVLLTIWLALVLVAAGFAAGFAVSKLPQLAMLGLTSTSDVGAKVNAVNKLLQSDALNPPSETSATAGSIQGLLDATGDKYATYFDAKNYALFNQDTQGSFGGIGVVLGENKNGQAYVVEVYDGTPAAKVGMKADDIFYVIAGDKRAGWTSDEVVNRVRGAVGTTLALTMLRPTPDGTGAPTEVSFTITREQITVPNIKTELKGTVGYIRLGQFNANAANDLKKAIQDLTAQGAKGFVFDLRDNPGGLLDQAIDVSSLFIASGPIVRVDQRDKPEEVANATGGKITDAPLVVLINGDSASASEIVAGALQDYGRAKLVGETSYGKGSVQTIAELGDGSAIKFTIAHYLTPNKRAIDGIGLTPDVEVKMDAADEMSATADTQLNTALDLIRSQIK
ncbi:MAG: S41 family peptidase [Coriobacteriia bacterium]|nr:S41 family peptidase [Coriobacteriia bacterium]